MKEGENLHSTPPDMEALVVDLDEPTRRLLAAVQKALSDGEWLHGGLRAVRIGDEVRRDMSITASEIAGPEATGYLERVIRGARVRGGTPLGKAWLGALQDALVP